MDFLKNFDIQLEKNVYFVGEIIKGYATVENVENVKVRAIHLLLRGRGHAEWKIMRNGERRTVKDDQHLLEDKLILWGKGQETLAC
ncbi:unnamed protein product [Soboliphyme baturini]|uniref:Arrestin_N domain-containing protein n=1 Tax=Soboliphyme baturini TaxID=241478 RepID=A0A183IW41_9BILA|nr:unnamed protein product [Soboliphyme baturini]